jgi:hypothetical protein
MLQIEGKITKLTNGATVSGIFTMAGKSGFDDFCFFIGTIRPEIVKGKLLGNFSGKQIIGTFKVKYSITPGHIFIEGGFRINFSRHSIKSNLDYDPLTGKFSTKGTSGLLKGI